MVVLFYSRPWKVVEFWELLSRKKIFIVLLVTILKHVFFSKIASTTKLEKCDYPYQGDGFCDDSNNHAGCDYDGEDCCLMSFVNQFCSACQCYTPHIPHSSYVSGKNHRSCFFSNGTFWLWSFIQFLKKPFFNVSLRISVYEGIFLLSNIFL